MRLYQPALEKGISELCLHICEKYLMGGEGGTRHALGGHLAPMCIYKKKKKKEVCLKKKKKYLFAPFSNHILISEATGIKEIL